MNVALPTTLKKHRINAALSLLLAVVFLAFTFLSFGAFITGKSTNSVASSTTGVTHAGKLGFLCSPDKVGHNMQPNNSWGKLFSQSDMESVSSRKLTIQEAFGRSLQYVAYFGEGEGPLFVREKESEAPEFVTVEPEKLEAQREVENCSLNTAILSLAGGILWIADSVSSVSQLAVSSAFNPNLVCDTNEANDNSKICLDLVGIIGGRNRSDQENSVFGSLTSSLYYPLIFFASVLAAIWIFYQGIVQRKLRQAWGSFTWTVLAAIFGAAVVTNPHMMTKAPMTVSNVAASCILGAFSGQGCDGQSTTSIDTSDPGGSVNGKSGSQRVCQSETSGGTGTRLAQAMDTTINSATCQIWKSFVLNPYAIANFGASFDDLDTKTGKGQKFVANGKGVDSGDFCVPLGSTGETGNGTLALGGGDQVCNLAAYQMYLMTNAAKSEDTGNVEKLESQGGVDERWYKIIEVAGNNPEMWSAWTGSLSSAGSKVWTSLFALVIAIIGNFIILVTAFSALAYYVSGILLMAFAPIFMLVGLHNGRGRRIMLGWLEKVISAVLKYVTSAAFVVVTISIYAGVLASNSNFAATIVFVVIVTIALFVYRKEFIEMMGRVDMGGQQLSSGLSDKLNKMGGGANRLAMSAAGGAIGSKMAGGTVMGGAKSGLKRNLKRGTGLIANAARENDNVKNNNRANLERQVRESKERNMAARQTALAQALRNEGFNPGFAEDENAPIVHGSGAGAYGKFGGSRAQRMFGAGQGQESGLDNLRNVRDDKEREKNELYDHVQDLYTRSDAGLRRENYDMMKEGVDYLDRAAAESPARAIADQRFMSDLADEIMQRNPGMDRESAMAEAENFVHLSSQVEMGEHGSQAYLALADATSKLPAFDGQQDLINSYNQKSQDYLNKAQNAQSQLDNEFSNITDIPMAGVASDYAPRTPREQQKFDLMKSQINADNFSQSDLRMYQDLERKQGEVAEIQDKLAQAHNEGAGAGKIAALQNKLHKANGEADSIAQDLDNTELGSHLKEMNGIGAEGSRDAFANNSEDIAEYHSRVDDSYQAGQMLEKKEKEYNQVAKEHAHLNDKVRQIEDSYDAVNVQTSERERAEVATNEKLIAGAYPGEGVSRRKINKERKKSAQQMIDDGVLPGKEEGTIRKAAKKTPGVKDLPGVKYGGADTEYAKRQSRRDVRGEGLDTDIPSVYDIGNAGARPVDNSVKNQESARRNPKNTKIPEQKTQTPRQEQTPERKVKKTERSSVTPKPDTNPKSESKSKEPKRKRKSRNKPERKTKLPDFDNNVGNDNTSRDLPNSGIQPHEYDFSRNNRWK